MTEKTLIRGPIAPTRGVDPWAKLSRTTGIIGLSAFVLIFTPIVAISTLGEPPFTATLRKPTLFSPTRMWDGPGWRTQF